MMEGRGGQDFQGSTFNHDPGPTMPKILPHDDDSLATLAEAPTSRRAFLRSASLTAVGGALVACGTGTGEKSATKTTTTTPATPVAPAESGQTGGTMGAHLSLIHISEPT